MRRARFSSAGDEVMGVGTDLLVSLFAIITCVFAFVAFQNQQQRAIISSLMSKDTTSLSMEVDDLESENASLQKTLQELEAKIASIEKKMTDLESKNAFFHAENVKLKARIEELQEFEDMVGKFSGSIDLDGAQKNQNEMVSDLALAYGVASSRLPSDDEDIEIFLIDLPDTKSGEDIRITNELTMQKLTFGSHLLFGSDQVELTLQGREILEQVGKTIRKQLHSINEIQIQGHADTDQSKKYSSNLELAAYRAMAVFQFFSQKGIDPSKHLMSATSFGEYKSAPKSGRYLPPEDRKARDRRVEILLFYNR